MKNVFVTCPLMLERFDRFVQDAAKQDLLPLLAYVIETPIEDELYALLPEYDG